MHGPDPHAVESCRAVLGRGKDYGSVQARRGSILNHVARVDFMARVGLVLASYLKIIRLWHLIMCGMSYDYHSV